MRIHAENGGRRVTIVWLATRALKALREWLIPLRPRYGHPGGARLAALTARIASRFWQLSTAATEVLDGGQRRR